MAQAALDERRWLSEHDNVYGTFMRISVAVNGWVGAPSARQARKIAKRLEKLQRTLEKHFQGEEGGLLERIAELLPEQRSQIEQLRVEHQEVSRRMTAVRATLAGGAPVELEAVPVEIDALVKLLYKHETVEERLAARALKWKSSERA